MNQKDILKLTTYYKNTGSLKWNIRKIEDFLHCKDPEAYCKSWNSRFAYSDVGHVFEKDGIMYKKTTIRMNGNIYNHRVHRLIWLYVTGEFPEQVDHIDGNGLNNKWENLRSVKQIVNSQNQSISKRNKSGFTGVSWSPKSSKWRVKIKVNGKYIDGGLFLLIEDAIKKRKQLNILYDFHRNHGRLK